MSSQLRGSVFGNRTKSHTIVIARGDRVRHWTMPSWMLGTLASVGAAVVIGGVGAMALSFSGDSVVRLMLDREVATTSIYEKRISGLRQELDRLTTRQHVDRDQIARQLHDLLSQQAQLVERFDTIAPLLDQAAAEGLIASSLAQPNDTSDDIPPAVAVVEHAFLSPVPADNGAVDHIRDVILPTIRESVGMVEDQQLAGIARLSHDAVEKAGEMNALLRPLGYEPAMDGGEGGPFVAPTTETSFDTQVRLLEQMLARIDHLRSAAEQLPLGDPRPAGTVRSSTYGLRTDPFFGRQAMHTGIDFAGATGTAVHATGDGRVVSAGDQGGYGLAIEIDHGNGVTTRFGHLSGIDVSVGQAVKLRERIGRIGSTGRSTGPHLHYEVRVAGEPIDPQRYIDTGHRWAKL